MTNTNSAKVMSGCIGQINELKLNEDDFKSWIELFELYINLNKINIHKKQFMFFALLGNEGYMLVRDLCRPKKPTKKNF